MTRICVIGAGNGGLSCCVQLAHAGHQIALWNRSEKTLDPLRPAGIGYRGLLGSGWIQPDYIGTDLDAAVGNAEAIVISLPTSAHEGVANLLATRGITNIPVILNPGHTGGALAFRHGYQSTGQPCPPLVEFSTLSYVARMSDPATVDITGVAGRVWAAPMAGHMDALALACELFPNAEPLATVLGSSLANVNMVLHPPGAMLAAAWVEATQGNFTFYVDAMTPAVAGVIKALDRERLTLARAFGQELPDLEQEMRAIGTIDNETSDLDLATLIRTGTPNRKIMAPDSLAHRYYIEDFWFGLKPFIALAAVADVDVPTAKALLALADAAKAGAAPAGRDARSMGIEGMDLPALQRYVETAA
ncbi:MAG: NAD/NADP octopine/nopaline dehydrogenase family protein [Haliea sp.]|uniref:NAD/NADP octopine/nopaline dehydrogenase family protein n=1 Tax=Haliea sp. TaxID=1932666 RepID=UPI0032EAC0A0